MAECAACSSSSTEVRSSASRARCASPSLTRATAARMPRRTSDR